MLKQKDKQLHFFAILAVCLIAYHFGLNRWLITAAAVAFAFAIEWVQLQIKNKKDNWKWDYDFPDVLAYLVGIVVFIGITLIKK